MRATRIACALIILLGSHCLPNVVAAATFSQVNLHGELYDPTTETVGGSDVGTAPIGVPDEPKTGSDVLDFGGTRSISSWTIASAENGRLAFNISSSIVVAPAIPSARLSAFIQSINNRVIDEFDIGPGVGPDGVLEVGESAQVLLQVRLDGEIQQQGRPSGGMQYPFQSRAGPGTVNLPALVDFDTGGLNLPQAFEIHEEWWDLLVDVTVGGVLGIDALMSGWINGTAFDAGQSGTNFINIDTIARVSNARGYHLMITSEAGAPTSTIPVATQFNDVTPDHWAFSFIETLADSGITAGCGNDNYCPDAPVNRDQMAVFLTRTFGL